MAGPQSASAKVCQICKEDCSSRPRQKDAQGRYTCKECADKFPKAKSESTPAKTAKPKPAPVADALAVALAGVDQASMTPCPNCAVLLKPGSVLCTACGFDIEKSKPIRTRVEILPSSSKGAAKAGRIALAASTTALLPVFWIVGGAVGGGIGAAIWAVIAATTGYEVSYVAALVGILVGVGVAVGNGGRGGILPGFAAAIIAVVSLLGGKYAAASYVVDKLVKEHHSEIAAVSDDDAVLALAEEIADEKQQSGTKLEWPDGQRPEFFENVLDFPPAIAQEAQTQWTSGDEGWKSEYRAGLVQKREAHLRDNKEAIREIGFLASFGFHDLLWFGLAIAVAFKGGSHDGTSDSKE